MTWNRLWSLPPKPLLFLLYLWFLNTGPLRLAWRAAALALPTLSDSEPSLVDSFPGSFGEV